MEAKKWKWKKDALVGGFALYTVAWIDVAKAGPEMDCFGEQRPQASISGDHTPGASASFCLIQLSKLFPVSIEY